VCASEHHCDAAVLHETIQPPVSSAAAVCVACYTGLSDNIHGYLQKGGGIGLGFAFTEVGISSRRQP